MHPKPICLRWFWHSSRRAASRAAWMAGNNKAIKMPMMAITTKSSTKVNPRVRLARNMFCSKRTKKPRF